MKNELIFVTTRPTFLALLMLCATSVFAQHEEHRNLLKNGGFEQLADTLMPHPCPTSPSQIFKALHWKAAFGSVDYFNSCSNSSYPDWGVPQNLYGSQVERDSQSFGGAYAALACYSNTMNDAREYLTTEISEVLVANRLYRLSFYVSLADSCNFAVGNIGACFTASSIEYLIPATQYFDLLTKVTYDSVPITDDEGWTRISKEFVADGNEKFLTIGNFKPDSETNVEQISPSVYEWDVSIYYIDDVLLEDLGTVGIDDEQQLSTFNLYPNPVNKDGWITVEYDVTNVNGTNVEFIVFDGQGRKVKVMNLPFLSTRIDLSKDGLGSGAFLYQLVVDGKPVHSGTMIVQ